MARGDASIPYPKGVTQTVAFTTSSARTTAGVDGQTRQVAVYASEDCTYNFGDSTVVATATDGTFLPAGNQHFMKIRGGQYVAAIGETTSGNLKVSELGY